MGSGPILVFDKSALQALNLDEAVWLDNFYLTNVTPLFFVETLADLEKEMKNGRQPEDVVGDISRKTPFGGMPNLHHSTIGIGELLGTQVPMRFGQIVVSGGRRSTTKQGEGIVFRQMPEVEALKRWRRHEFQEVERLFAKTWRESLKSLEWRTWYSRFRALMGRDVPGSSLESVRDAVDHVLEGSENQAALIDLAADLVGAPAKIRVPIIECWVAGGEKRLPEHAPYVAHLVRVDAFFGLAVELGLISDERLSNRVDLAYLYYLPFCMVFSSYDKFHRRTAPLFMRERQDFVWGGDLKSDLRALDDYYTGLPEEVKARGVMTFAQQPPREVDFLTTRLWDKYLPSWREPTPVKASPEQEKQLIAEFTRAAENAESPQGIMGPGVDDPAFVMIEQEYPVRRGKWTIVPPEAERKS